MYFEMKFLSELAKTAGEKLLEYWPGSNKNQNNLKIEIKTDGSFVTEADLASTKIIEEGLSKRFLGDYIVSEEGDNHDVDLRNHTRAWVIDPLDGTHPFISGHDDFSVLISLVEFGKPTIGIMYFPAKNLLITASKNDKAIQNETLELSVSKSKNPREEGIYVRNCELNLDKKYLAPKVDSGFAFYNVARGDFDGAVIKMSSHKIWDIAAPMVVIQAAGGKVTDQKGEELVLSGVSMEGVYFVAGNRELHQKLLVSI